MRETLKWKKRNEDAMRNKVDNDIDKRENRLRKGRNKRR